MASIHSLSPVVSKPATGNGDIDGHAVRCSCGFHAGTSLGEREALKQGWDHINWARKAGR